MSNKITKSNGQIVVYGTKEGKLYIKPEDLFSQSKVRSLIEKVVNSEVLKNLKTVAH